MIYSPIRSNVLIYDPMQMLGGENDTDRMNNRRSLIRHRKIETVNINIERASSASQTSTANEDNQSDTNSNTNDITEQTSRDWRIPCENARISFAEVRNAGPPIRERDFPQPIINIAMVDNITYYDVQKGQFKQQQAVFRVSEGGDRRLTDCAYLLSAENVRTSSQMGCVQICRVVVRNVPTTDDDSDLDGDCDLSRKSSLSSDEDNSISSSDTEMSMNRERVRGRRRERQRVHDNNRERDFIFQLTNRYVAVKISCKQTVMQRWASGEARAENPWQEIAAAQLIGNAYPNLLGIIEAFHDRENLYTIMPYCPGGDLYDYIDKHRERTESHARHCFTQILQGLNQLHVCGIFHRDLSIENILLVGDRCVMIDFGMSLRIPQDEDGTRRLFLPQGACGKVRYMAPETFANRVGLRYAIDGPSCDLWAAGVILFVLLTGKFPYLQPDANDVAFCWATNDIAGLLQTWGIKISNSALDLLKNIFQLHPMRRYSLAQVMEHPWVTNTEC